jgi:hypothetical protein
MEGMYYVATVYLLLEYGCCQRILTWELKRKIYYLVSRSGPAVCFYANVLKNADTDFILVIIMIATVTDYLIYEHVPVVLRVM